MFAHHHTSFVLAILLLATPFGGGCASDDDAPKTYSRKGRVTSVDLASRRVTIMTKDKTGVEKPFSGTYTDETIVIINGRNMTIKDIKEGDTVEVVARKEGEDTNQRFVATEVRITRYEGDWQETGKNDREDASTTKSAKSEPEN